MAYFRSGNGSSIREDDCNNIGKCCMYQYHFFHNIYMSNRFGPYLFRIVLSFTREQNFTKVIVSAYSRHYEKMLKSDDLLVCLDTDERALSWVKIIWISLHITLKWHQDCWNYSYVLRKHLRSYQLTPVPLLERWLWVGKECNKCRFPRRELQDCLG